MGRKIKRTKTLFRRRKSKVKIFFNTLFFGVIIVALVVVGYSAGETVVNFFKNQELDSSSTTVWTPDDTTDSQNPQDSSDETEDSNQPPIQQLEGGSYYRLPPEPITKDSLASALALAKEENVENIVVLLKGEKGEIYYNSTLPTLKTTNIEGQLTLEEIAKTIRDSDFIPVGEIGTLKDHNSPGFVTGTTYKFADGSYNWLDNTPENGGKGWLSPFLQPTVDFLTSMVKEAKDNGFDEVVLADLIFPPFTNYDKSVLAHVADETKRANGLYDLATAIKNESDNALFQLSAKDVVEKNDAYSKTAELLNHPSAVTDFNFAVVYSEAEIGAELKIGDTKVTLSKETPTAVKEVFQRVISVIPKEKIVAVIDSEGLSAEDFGNIKGELSQLGIVRVIKK